MVLVPDRRHREGVAAGPPALPPSMRDRVPFLLYRASQISHSLANEMLADVALSARQAGIMTLVTELAPMTQRALGDALRIDRTTMVTLLDDLEDKGYVTRQRHRAPAACVIVGVPRTCAVTVAPAGGSIVAPGGSTIAKVI